MRTGLREDRMHKDRETETTRTHNHTKNIDCAYLIGAVEKCQNIALLHGDLTGGLLCVVVQSHHLLCANVVNDWSFLLLQT